MQQYVVSTLIILLCLMTACQPSVNPNAGHESQPAIAIFNMADMHSGYDAYPILLRNIDQYAAQHPQTKTLFVINGDYFEAGSVVAQKSHGKLDMAFLAELKQRGEVVFNIGNHDFDIIGMHEFIPQAEALGVRVIGTFASSELTTALAAFTDIQLGAKTLRFIGVNTDHIRTFPAAMRANLTIPVPQDWLAQHYAEISQGADYNIILSHAGVTADKTMLEFLSKQARQPVYMLGAHDHLSLQTTVNDMPYLHTTFKGQRLVVVELRTDDTLLKLTINNLLTDFSQAGDPAFRAQINATRETVLSPEDKMIVGKVTKELSFDQAVAWTLDTLREKTGADVALFNHSSFGSGLPQGPLAQYRFNQFMRFENKLMMTTVDGQTLKTILARANQHLHNDIAQLSGDFVYANTLDVQEQQSYTIVTPDWVTLADNQLNYLGMQLNFWEFPDTSVKTLLKESLNNHTQN